MTMVFAEKLSKATHGKDVHRRLGLCALLKTLEGRPNGRATQPLSVVLGKEPLQHGGLLHCQPHHILIQVHLQGA